MKSEDWIRKRFEESKEDLERDNKRRASELQQHRTRAELKWLSRLKSDATSSLMTGIIFGYHAALRDVLEIPIDEKWVLSK